MSKKVAALVVACMSGISVANAADMYVKANAPLVPQINWTGFYVGADAGYSWSRASDFIGFGPETDNVSPRGAFVGLHAGYDYQLPNNWVLGARIAAPVYSSVKASTISAALGTISYEAKANWAVLATGQVGYAIGQFLPYVGGGLAFVSSKATINNFIPGIGPTLGAQLSQSQTYVGGVFLAGVRYALTNNWSIGAEYNYINAGSKTYTFGTATRDVAFTSSEIYAMVNYKF